MLTYNRFLYCHMLALLKYKYAWWKSQQLTSLDMAQFLNKSTLQICMNTHREQLVAYIPTEDDDRFKLDKKRQAPAMRLTTYHPLMLVPISWQTSALTIVRTINPFSLIPQRHHRHSWLYKCYVYSFKNSMEI